MSDMTPEELEECVQNFFGCPAEEVLEVWQRIDSDGDGDTSQYVFTGSSVDDPATGVTTHTIVLTDGEGNEVESYTFEEDDSIFAPAPADGVDDAGQPYTAGQNLLTLDSGAVLCWPEKDNDTRATPDGAGGFTAADGEAIVPPATDAAGEPIDPDAEYNVFDNMWYPVGGPANLVDFADNPIPPANGPDGDAQCVTPGTQYHDGSPVSKGDIMLDYESVRTTWQKKTSKTSGLVTASDFLANGENVWWQYGEDSDPAIEVNAGKCDRCYEFEYQVHADMHLATVDKGQGIGISHEVSFDGGVTYGLIAHNFMQHESDIASDPNNARRSRHDFMTPVRHHTIVPPGGTAMAQTRLTVRWRDWAGRGTLSGLDTQTRIVGPNNSVYMKGSLA